VDRVDPGASLKFEFMGVREEANELSFSILCTDLDLHDDTRKNPKIIQTNSENKFMNIVAYTQDRTHGVFNSQRNLSLPI